MIIAIDGTLASGKGTIAKRLAAWYGIPHMDTGRLYRATGVAALKKFADFSNSAELANVASCLDLDDFAEDELRTAEAGMAASKVAAVPEVRAALLDLQRKFASRPKGAVLDGRDIGTVVCPNAKVKFWIDARVEIRAERRNVFWASPKFKKSFTHPRKRRNGCSRQWCQGNRNPDMLRHRRPYD